MAARRFTTALVGIAAAAVAFAPADGAGDINATPEAIRILQAAIMQLDCRVVHPTDEHAAPVPWCLRNPRAPRSADTAIEALAIQDGIERLRRSGFDDPLNGLAIIHFASSAIDEGFLPALEQRAHRSGGAELMHAVAVARDIGHSYYLHEKAVIALRPEGWEQEVRQQMRVQFRWLKDKTLDPIAFPIYVSLYHEFAHRLLDYSARDIVHGSRAETAADLFAATMIARQYGLDFTRVARAFAKARQVREPLEDDMHRTANLLMASLTGLAPAEAQPAPSFASIRRIVFALADSAIGTAEATIPEPSAEMVCTAPADFRYDGDVGADTATSRSR